MGIEYLRKIRILKNVAAHKENKACKRLLSSLRRFPINTLKVDRSFVSDLNAFEKLIIVRTIVSLAHNLGFDVVAEGIETDRQRDFLAELSCEYGQGFLFLRPLSEDKALELVAVCGPRPEAGS